MRMVHGPTTHQRRVLAWALVVTVGAAVLGAGGACSPASADGAGDVAAAEWAGRVCAALGPWQTQINDLTTQAQQQMQSASTPGETRQNLLVLLTGAQTASEQARVAVEGAGVPNVTGGDEIARRFVASLAGSRDAYAQAGTELRTLPTDDVTAFYDGVVTVMATLTTEYAQHGVQTSGLDSPELRNAFEESERCR